VDAPDVLGLDRLDRLERPAPGLVDAGARADVTVRGRIGRMIHLAAHKRRAS
jgi:hypothetical protein